MILQFSKPWAFVPTQHTGSNFVSRDLYILWGQSQLGRARVSEMNASQSALYSGSASNAFIMNPFLSNKSASFYPMIVGQNTMLANQNNLDEFGFEASFNYQLQVSSSLKPRYYLKYGVGNTDMFDGWAVGQLYHNNLINYIEAAVIWGKQNNINFNLKGYLFRQGEGDVDTFAHASPWGDRLVQQFQDVDSFWQQMQTRYNLPASTFPVPKALGRVRDYTNNIQYPGPFSSLVRGSTDQYAVTGSNNAASINTDSYPTEADNLHDNPTGEIQCGIDFYNSGLFS